MCLSVNNCCCFVTLDVGTKIIGVISTLSALVSLLVFGPPALLGAGLPQSRLLFYAGMAVTAVLQFFSGCFLIYGAFAHKPKYTIPWTAVSWCLSVLLLVLAVTGTVLLSYNRNLETTADISTAISLYFLYALMLFYFASVVTSRRQQMVLEGRTEVAKRLTRHRVLPNYYV